MLTSLQKKQFERHSREVINSEDKRKMDVNEEIKHAIIMAGGLLHGLIIPNGMATTSLPKGTTAHAHRWSQS